MRVTNQFCSSQEKKLRRQGTNGGAKVDSGDLMVSGTRVLELLYEQLMARSLQFEHCGCSPPHFWCLVLHMSHVGVRCGGLATRKLWADDMVIGYWTGRNRVGVGLGRPCDTRVWF